MKKLKIGYLVKMYPRLSETFILNEISELERRGVEVVIFSLLKPNEGRFHPQVTQIKAPVVYLDGFQGDKGWEQLRMSWPTLAPHRKEFWELCEEAMVSGKRGALKLFLSAAVVADHALKSGIDHLHAHFASTPSTVAYYASGISGLSFSFTAHAKGIFREGIDRDLLERKINAAQSVITVTEFNKRHMLSTFPSVVPNKIKVVYNGIDVELFNQHSESLRELNHIFAVGRLVPKKGFSDLLEACSILKERGVSFHCSIVGEGDQREVLAESVLQLGLNGLVDLVGPKTQLEVLDGMSRCGVFVLPCTKDIDGNQDALPTVLLEALASGIPVVSTDISGVPEIIDSGVDGLLVSPDDPSSLADSIQKIFADRDLAERFAINGRTKAEDRFDLRKSVAKLEGDFRQEVPRSLITAGAMTGNEERS